MNSALYSLRTNSDENTAVVENIQEPSISSSAYNWYVPNRTDRLFDEAEYSWWKDETENEILLQVL